MPDSVLCFSKESNASSHFSLLPPSLWRWRKVITGCLLMSALLAYFAMDTSKKITPGCHDGWVTISSTSSSLGTRLEQGGLRREESTTPSTQSVAAQKGEATTFSPFLFSDMHSLLPEATLSSSLGTRPGPGTPPATTHIAENSSIKHNGGTTASSSASSGIHHPELGTTPSTTHVSAAIKTETFVYLITGGGCTGKGEPSPHWVRRSTWKNVTIIYPGVMILRGQPSTRGQESKVRSLYRCFTPIPPGPQAETNSWR